MWQTRMGKGSWLLAVAGGLLVAGGAGATVVVQPSLERMTARAELVAHVRVEHQRFAQGEEGRPLTLTRLRVLDAVKGVRNGQSVTLYQVGGKAGERTGGILGSSHFRVGEEVVLFGARFLATNTVKFLQAARRGQVPLATLYPSGGFVVPYGIGLGKFTVDRSGAVPVAVEELGDVSALVPGPKGRLVPGRLVQRVQPLEVLLDELRVQHARGVRP